ncbi:MAG: hypothetical protein FWC92_00795 [Defluviitaleaceae bacterium]|nr:hypothetical protein [Defluviitaleaceae bacterium]
MYSQNTMKLTMAGLLIAIGIMIPMYSPLRLLLPPASFTLASHTAIFIAMFISPPVAVIVAAGTTIGFLLGGFPIIIVLRAATHVVFAFLGALYLSRAYNLSAIKLRAFSFVIGVIHAVGEVIVVSVFFFGGNISAAHLEQGFFVSVLLLIGAGSVVHSMVDFEIAQAILLPLRKQRKIAAYFV